MKFKLLIACSVAISMASCSKKDATTGSGVAGEVTSVDVAAGLEGLTYTLEGDEFVKQDVSKDTEYFLVYFSASW